MYLTAKTFVMRQLLYFLFAIGIIVASSSCKKETPELPENYIAYKKQNYDIEKLSVTYFGSRMSVLEFSLPDSSKMELTITNGTLDSLTEGKYAYGTIDMGFRMVLILDNEEIKAKNGSIQIFCDEATKHYTFEFDITTQSDLQVLGNYTALVRRL